MKKIFCVFASVLFMAFPACSKEEESTFTSETKEETVSYEQISQTQAKKIMDSGKKCVILDVREQDEYDAGHIPGALLIPYTQIEEKAPTLLPDRGELILVYCRSGRRSKIASESLVKLGYTQVKEFGGIIDWEYEIER